MLKRDQEFSDDDDDDDSGVYKCAYVCVCVLHVCTVRKTAAQKSCLLIYAFSILYSIFCA